MAWRSLQGVSIGFFMSYGYMVWLSLMELKGYGKAHQLPIWLKGSAIRRVVLPTRKLAPRLLGKPEGGFCWPF